MANLNEKWFYLEIKEATFRGNKEKVLKNNGLNLFIHEQEHYIVLYYMYLWLYGVVVLWYVGCKVLP